MKRYAPTVKQKLTHNQSHVNKKSVNLFLTTITPMTFGEWLQTELEKREIKQADLARRTGITRATISNYVNDLVSQPRRSELDKIARALGVKAEDVYLAASRIQTRRPETVREFLDALESLGVGHFESYGGLNNLGPEALGQLYDDVRDLIDLFFIRRKRKMKYIELEIEPDESGSPQNENSGTTHPFPKDRQNHKKRTG